MAELIQETLSTPVAGSYDIIVAGAGPAGVAAAVTAGRLGAGALLLQGVDLRLRDGFGARRDDDREQTEHEDQREDDAYDSDCG